jgi:signal transduction histidine kinase
MERGIARCRVFLSLIAILALYVDPTEPHIIDWLPIGSGWFSVNRYWATVLVGHLVYSVTLFVQQARGAVPAARLAAIATWGDVLFAVAVAAVTEGTTSPFYSFFAFAVLTAGLRSGMRAALWVTSLSVGLYIAFVVASAPSDRSFYIVMRAAYIAITGYLVGYLGQERLNQEARLRKLEAGVQREHIARSLHDGYAQALAGVNLRLEACRELLRRGEDAAAVDGELSELQAGVNREHDELRSYIRSLLDRDVVHGGRSTGEATRVSVTATFQGSAAFVEHVLLIMLEGVRNVRRHAQARSAFIGTDRTTEGLLVTIDDDGIGFPAGAPLPWSIASRVEECGGRLAFRNDGLAGAHVRITLPGA